MKMFRTVLAAVVFVFAIGLLSSVSAQLAPSVSAEDAAWRKVLAAGKKEGTATPVSTVITGKPAIKVMKIFRDKYGISLEFYPGRIGAASEKIITEQRSKSYVTDSLDTHGFQILVLKSGGFLQSVAASLPALREKGKFTRPIVEDPEAQLINIAGTSTYVVVNTNLVKPGEEPKSYLDLLNPKWKGKIILMNPLYNSSPDEVMFALTQAKTGLDESYFKKLYQNAVIGGPGGGDQAIDKLVRGEFAIGGFFASGTILRPLRNGAPIKPLDLKEGYVSMPVRVGAMKNMPHPNATRVYLNWLLTQEGQSVMVKETGLEPLRNDVPGTLPFHLKGPRINLTYYGLVRANDRSTKNYMADFLGLKK